MASYSAVIDVRVAGLNDVQTLQERVAAVEGVIKRIKPVPAIFDQRVKKEVKEVAKDLSDLIESFAKGGGRFASTVAGLNQQLTAFRTAAGNAKVGSDQFNDSLTAGEKVSRKLAAAEAERLQALNKIYSNEQTQGRTRTTGVQEILDLGKKIPDSIAGLELYRAELSDLLKQVTIGTSDFYALGQAIDAVDSRLNLSTRKGSKQGPKKPPPSGNMDAILGGAFPLLFGGGPGAVLGGAAGGKLGGAMGGMAGMALSVGLSAVGMQLDTLVAKMAEVGNAANTLNVDTLRDSFIYVNAEVATTVRRLQEAGQADEARLLLLTKITEQTAILPSEISRSTAQVDNLKESWNSVVAATAGAGTLLGELIIPGLTGLLNLLAKVIQGANIVYQILTGKWIGAIQEYNIRQKAQSGELDRIRERMYGISEEEQKRIALLQQVIDKQKTELDNAQKSLDLERDRQLGRTQAEKEINALIDERQAANKIEAEFAQKAKDIQKEYANAYSAEAKRQLEETLKNNEALKATALTQQAIKDSLVQQGLAIEANTEKYNQAATAVQNQIAALDRGNAVTNSRYGVEAALNDLYGAQLERQYQLATTETERFQIALRMFDQQINAARIEYNQALANNQLLVQKAELEAKLTEIKLQQLEAEKQISLAYAESRGAGPEVLAKLAAGYDKGLTIQKSVVEESYKQLQATSEIAANQDKVAEAVYKTKIIQAESQLAQKLASDEIGMSKENADMLAGALAIGVTETHRLNGAMSDVAASAHNAAVNITRAFYAQQQLNAAQGGGGGGGGGKTPAPTGAAAGAYWAGGFKAFAKGGMVNKPTLGLIGEGGEPEYIVPESKAKNFAMNYLMGARGASAIPKFAEGGYAGPGSANVSIQTGPVMQMNGANYVTTAQMQQAVQAGVDRTLALIAGDQNMRRSVGIY